MTDLDPAWSARAKRLIVGRSLAECVESGRDNILQLRLLAALLVVLGHSYVLVGHDAATFEPLHRLLPRTYSHLIGVTMFFTISGFLITLSYQRRPDLLRFVRARALRLWPALALVVAACAFVFGPMLTVLSLRDYFGQGDIGGTAYRYFWTNISLVHIWPTLPGLFGANPIAHHVNGSLWTIPYEAAMYVCVAGAGAVGLLRFPWMASAVIAVACAVFVAWPILVGTPSSYGIPLLGLGLAGCFGAGSIACLLRRYVPISTGIMIVLAVIALAARDTLLIWAAVLYFVFWFAYVPRIPGIPRRLDLSYATYLWAFPVQQSVILLVGVTSPLALFAVATPIVMLIAAASWSWIEKPVLRLKSGRPRDADVIAAAPITGAVSH